MPLERAESASKPRSGFEWTRTLGDLERVRWIVTTRQGTRTVYTLAELLEIVRNEPCAFKREETS